VRELLKGAVDIHIHGSPSIAPRVETWGFLREMDEAGYRAVCIKEHFVPTTALAYAINKAPCAPKTQVFGCLVLNSAVGGLNCTAVDSALQLGARQVFFPTTSSKNHADYLKTVAKFGGGRLNVPEPGWRLIDEKGEPVPEAGHILDFLAQNPEITLSMGHLSPQEIDVLLPQALSRGLKKVVIDHPYFIIGASVGQVRRWSSMGAYINFTCSSLENLGRNGHVPLDVLDKTLDAVPEDRLLVSTDFGQPYNGSPVEGLYKMICILLKDLKVPEHRVRAMTQSIPAALLGLSPL
jgi:hypothetical protein